MSSYDTDTDMWAQMLIGGIVALACLGFILLPEPGQQTQSNSYDTIHVRDIINREYTLDICLGGQQKDLPTTAEAKEIIQKWVIGKTSQERMGSKDDLADIFKEDGVEMFYFNVRRSYYSLRSDP